MQWQNEEVVQKGPERKEECIKTQRIYIDGDMECKNNSMKAVAVPTAKPRQTNKIDMILS